jgi:cytochrome c5
MKKINILTSVALCLIMGQALAIEPVYEGEDGIRAKVFATNCLACHSSELTGSTRNGAHDGDNVDTYVGAIALGDELIEEAVEKMDMPPESSGLLKLDDQQKQALKNWKALGYPEKTLPTIYSSESTNLSLPQVYLKDANGDISLQWKANMKIIPGTDPIQFELIDAVPIQ